MKVMNLLLEKQNKNNSKIRIKSRVLSDKGGNSVECVPGQDAQRRVSVFDEAHSAVVVPLVLHGHAADLDYHLPQLLGRASTLLGTGQLFAGGGQELTHLDGTFSLIINNQLINSVKSSSGGHSRSHLDVGVVHDQRGRHLQGQIVVLSPVQHEGDALLSDHLTQRQIWGEKCDQFHLRHLQFSFTSCGSSWRTA